MLYLYAGLGMAMMVGITAMIDVAFDLSGQQLAASGADDVAFTAKSEGFDSSLRDRDVLLALQRGYQATWDGNLCQQIKGFVASSGSGLFPFLASDINSYQPVRVSTFPAVASPLAVPCGLLREIALANNRRVYHKIVLIPRPAGSAPAQPGFLSCVVNVDPLVTRGCVVCPYEQPFPLGESCEV